MANVDPELGDEQTPRHVAIIMDGNRRWARKRRLPKLEGHRRGAEAVRESVRAAADLGIAYLTIFAFSSENWRRPADEIDDLMGLLRLYLRRELAELHRNGVRVRIMGARAGLAQDIVGLIDQAEETTRHNARLTLTIALNYGGQQEIVHAARQMAEKAARGELDPADIDEAMLERHLYTPDLPAPELLIRTSGEQRISNFMLWQTAYTELVFDDILWPDFDRAALKRALEQYGCRERRFGGQVG